MEIPVQEAAGRLEELVEAAQAGQEVLPTYSGRGVARLVSVGGEAVPVAGRQHTRDERRAMMHEVMEYGRQHATPGPSAAGSQDFLLDDNGLPA